MQLTTVNPATLLINLIRKKDHPAQFSRTSTSRKLFSQETITTVEPPLPEDNLGYSISLIQTAPPVDLSLSTLEHYPHLAALYRVLAAGDPTKIKENIDPLTLLWLEHKCRRRGTEVYFQDFTLSELVGANLLEELQYANVIINTADNYLTNYSPEQNRSLVILGRSQEIITIKLLQTARKVLDELNKEFISMKDHFKTTSDDEIKKFSLRVLDPTDNYSVQGQYEKNEHPRTSLYSMFLDIPFGIAIMHEETEKVWDRETNSVKSSGQRKVPVAFCTFSPIDPKKVLIFQLQGVRPKKISCDENGHVTDTQILGSTRSLCKLDDYKKLLITITGLMCKEAGFSQLGILSGENNKWVYIQDKQHKVQKVHLPLEQAKNAYDVTATRLGFTKDPTDNNFYYPLVNK